MDRLDLVLRPGADARELSADALRVLYDAVRVEMEKRVATFPPEQDTTELVAHGVLLKFRRSHQRFGSGYHTELWIGEYAEVEVAEARRPACRQAGSLS
jgi:hypothetical protein